VINILIVDDNANNRMMLRFLLEDYEEEENVEFSIDDACDGLQAVQKCESTEYKLILMDIMMPNMDGIEATRIIKEKDKNVTVVAVSAADDSKELILNVGAVDYISKPVDVDMSSDKLRTLIV